MEDGTPLNRDFPPHSSRFSTLRRGQNKQPDSVLVRGPEVMEEGLVYRVEYSAVAGGYFSDRKFNFCLGTPIKESYATWREHRNRQIFMEEFIRPGMSKREVYAGCQQEFTNVDEYMWWIHGVGMEVHEEPQLGSLLPHSLAVTPEITYEENNVSALELSWLVEDIYVLKADGFKWLGTSPQELALFEACLCVSWSGVPACPRVNQAAPASENKQVGGATVLDLNKDGKPNAAL